MAFTYPDAAFIGTLLSMLFTGVYVTVFGLYTKIIRVRKGPLMVLDYGLIFLFILSMVTVVLDTTQQFYTLMRPEGTVAWTAKVNATASVLGAILDFTSQAILIYRCWNVWGRKLWVIIAPAFLAFASLGVALAVTIDLASVPDSYLQIGKSWWVPVGVTTFSLSLAVNTLVSALMISRIWYVYSQTKSAVETSGSRLSWVASVLLESTVILFVAQLIYLVLYRIEHPAFSLVAMPVTILYGLNCTAIMVRVGMNQSYESMAAASTAHSTIQFNSNKPGMSLPASQFSRGTTHVSETGSEKGYAAHQYSQTASAV
ncbi:hypothetical protein D9611_001101 [Ephemerocybe angulata]|uniref:Uncharacterized protein n=2 Tax=Ephemerocybe angulata TaxID=980116 RepID=A0A8H6I1I9_9AGAR|nr:hypothetical protein D9611_001101 [Tulosesus angulatus]KAF6746850.1 hypothetical protein DFP72DRAFT_1150390 [Tulosesus angulatus]KAF6756969.1 hypothetical protein DFP72DRAFT_892843 [Tulosesus angulatus]